MKKIIVINLGGIGDLLLSTPALRTLRNFYPQAKISLLVTPQAAEMAKFLPYIDVTILIDVKMMRKFFSNFLILLKLRKEKFDLAVNMRSLVSKASALKMRFLLGIIGAKIKAGRNTSGKGKFFDVSIPESDIGNKYEMEYDIELIKILGAEVSDRKCDVPVDAESRKNIKALLEKNGIADSSFFIAIHPGGKPSHRWPPENFAELITRISEKISCAWVITGSSDELVLAEEIRKKTQAKIIDLTGKLSLKELSALIERCSLFISNDTAPMHIAAVLGKPLVALFGPGYLQRFNPQNIDVQSTVIAVKAECSPCNKVICEKKDGCMSRISTDEVVMAVMKKI